MCGLSRGWAPYLSQGLGHRPSHPLGAAKPGPHSPLFKSGKPSGDRLFEPLDAQDDDELRHSQDELPTLFVHSDRESDVDVDMAESLVSDDDVLGDIAEMSLRNNAVTLPADAADVLRATQTIDARSAHHCLIRVVHAHPSRQKTIFNPLCRIKNSELAISVHNADSYSDGNMAASYRAALSEAGSIMLWSPSMAPPAAPTAVQTYRTMLQDSLLEMPEATQASMPTSRLYATR